MSARSKASVVASASALWLLPAIADAQPAPSTVLSADGTPATESDDGAVEEGWFAGRRGFAAKLSLGPAYRRLFFSDIVTMDAEFAFGAQTEYGGIYGTAGGMSGSTIHGLWVGQGFIGASWEAPAIEGLHIGGGPRFSYLAIKRVTTGNRMDDFGIGLWAHATYDVFADVDGAVFVGLRAGGDYNIGGDDWPPPIIYGATLTGGVRLF